MTTRFPATPALRAALVTSALLTAAATAAAAEPIPHGQTRAPNAPMSAEEAARAMTVPEGFAVEVVAGEPDLVNPVAMTFDDRGRVWVTESLEYPRKSAGPGRDRVKVLEDTDGDGKADRFSVFAEGLNIPSGIAVGHGGVWVANAPDILFLRDTDGDGKADAREVVVTGFGRSDTHELPNSLSWGPDGWLYGWNGVFNPSHVEYRGKTHDFTCAVFRIHPRTRDFEVFCEGTSNPWGITWDAEGSAFASACVIDHLWHLTESGYYHRQGGPYPPFTWKIESIVGHRHQKAAYCGIHYYDSDAYPAEYRGTLFMGNIHGNGVNRDRLRRVGSTYAADAAPDFLAANDAWFMPVAQKTGPDGSLYVLDWYDRYHCYQDANRDPAGIDRLKGRLYRVRYKETPRRTGFDLAGESDDRLVARLDSPNGYDRETARRLLAERTGATTDDRLEALALDTAAPRRTRMNALWARVSRATPDPAFLLALTRDPDPGVRAWGVRAAGNLGAVPDGVRAAVVALARDPSPDVALQAAVAARKVEGVDPVAVLAEVAAHCGDDPLIPHVVWQNLHPLLDDRAAAGRLTASLADAVRAGDSPAALALAPRVVERLMARKDPGGVDVAGLVAALIASKSAGAAEAAVRAVETVGALVQSGELRGDRLAGVKSQLAPVVAPLLSGPKPGRLGLAAAVLATSWNDKAGLAATRAAVASAGADRKLRVDAVNALIAAGDPGVLDAVAAALDDPQANPVAFRGQLLASLGRLDDDRVAGAVLARYPAMEPELQPRAVELLAQREAWGKALLGAVASGVVKPASVNLNQVRKLAGFTDPEVKRLVRAHWGTVREGRDPAREQVVAEVRKALRASPGDPTAGALVFNKVCAQCHKIYGEGQEVGPDITLNGRGSYDQLLSNVLDPSLVIGEAYQATTVATTDGRVLTGLLAERSPQRVVLKLQGGKLETVPAGKVDEVKLSPLSLMPEDLRTQLTPRELADLFAYLTLDRPPSDPAARPIPGAQEVPRLSPGGR